MALRYPGVADVDELLRLGTDPEVTRFFSWGPYRDRAEPEAYIGSLGARRTHGETLEFAVTDARDRLIGITGLSDFSVRDRRATVGTWLGREYWGTGVNAESKALILHLAFRGLELQRVSALADPRNGRSLRALERLGFEREGVLRSWQLHRGSPRDCVILRMTRAEFERQPVASGPAAISGEVPAAFVP